MIGLNFRGLPGLEFRGRLWLVDHQDPDAGKDTIGEEAVSLVFSLDGVGNTSNGESHGHVHESWEVVLGCPRNPGW